MMNKIGMDTGFLSVGAADIHQVVAEYIHYFTDSTMRIFHLLSGLILQLMVS